MNLKIGDRCIVIYSLSGDEGALVEVSGFMGESDCYGHFLWNPSYNVIVNAMGVELHSINNISGEIFTHQSRPYPEEWLRKLSDIADEVEAQETQEVTE